MSVVQTDDPLAEQAESATITPNDNPESPYGPKNEQLPEQLVNALKSIATGFSKQEQYIRRREVIRDRRHRFYERGYQHIYEGRNGVFVQGTAGAVISIEGRDIQCPNYIDDYNIFQPYERIIESVLTQNPPGIDFQPIDPNRSEDNEAAETAEGYRKFFDRSNDVKDIQTDIVRMMCLSGRVVLWTRTEANAEKWGQNEDGSPKQMEICTVHGTLESRVPIMAKSQDKSMYLWLLDDPDVKQAKNDYPDFAKKITPNMSSLCESAYERTARLGVLQGSRSLAQMGDAFSHLVSRANVWLRPASFNGDGMDDLFETPDEGDVKPEGQPFTIRDKLIQLFPCGVHAVFIGEVYVGSWAESMDDHIVIGFPYKGDGMFRLCIMDPMVTVQDRFNDNMNAAAEVFDMGWPSTWVNAEQSEYDAILEQKADPYAIRMKKARAGMKMNDEFFREPNPELPATFLEWNDFLQGALPQFILACPPALYGEAMTDQKTASGYNQARAQAMGQQGIFFGVIQWLMARMYYQAALCASSNPDHSQEIVIPGDGGQTSTLRLERLTKGKFGAYPDEDSSFPESTAAKRATLNGILAMAVQDPVLGAQLMSSPENWKVFLTLMGFPELVIPEAEARDKQVFEIEELLKGSPVPPTPEELEAALVAHAAQSVAGQVAGGPQPPPPDLASMMKSSVPVDELDFHAWEFAECQEWLSSGARRRQEAEGNYVGIQNVKLHALEHQKMMALLAPPPMPMPIPAPGGAKKPGGPPPSAEMGGPPAAPPPAPAAPATM